MGSLLRSADPRATVFVAEEIDWVNGSTKTRQEERRRSQAVGQRSGFFAKSDNVLTDVEKVLRITKAFYKTGSYDHLDEVGNRGPR